MFNVVSGRKFKDENDKTSHIEENNKEFVQRWKHPLDSDRSQ